mmetsp:Transcript_19274/g.35955  ORF Transcript_19274/g.35955 Transcript_19274/m.35955 type:complete len:145 (+) Transcript_19274:128-562(+)
MKTHQECFRALIRAISIHEKEIMKMCDNNQYVLNFLDTQLASKALRENRVVATAEEEYKEDVDLVVSADRASIFDLYTNETQLTVQKRKDGDDLNDTTGDVDGGISMVIDREKKSRKNKKVPGTVTGVGAGGSTKKQKKQKKNI